MWLSGLGVVPQIEMSWVQFPVRAHAWVVGFDLRVGRTQGAADGCLPPSLPPTTMDTG